MSNVHFLGALPFDMTRPGAQDLLGALRAAYPDQDTAASIVNSAGMSPSSIDWNGSMDVVWVGIIYSARGQDKLRALVSAAVNDERVQDELRLRLFVLNAGSGGAAAAGSPTLTRNEELWLAEGRAQGERIASAFGWEWDGGGYSSEETKFRDPRNATLVRFHDGPTPASHRLSRDAARALLRHLIALESPGDGRVAYYFDVTAGRHVRVALDDKRAGRIVVDGDIRARIRGL